jgi:hypothetical protein
VHRHRAETRSSLGCRVAARLAQLPVPLINTPNDPHVTTQQKDPQPQHMLVTMGSSHPLHAEAHSSLVIIFMSSTDHQIITLLTYFGSMPQRANVSLRQKIGIQRKGTVG